MLKFTPTYRKFQVNLSAPSSIHYLPETEVAIIFFTDDQRDFPFEKSNFPRYSFYIKSRQMGKRRKRFTRNFLCIPGAGGFLAVYDKSLYT